MGRQAGNAAPPGPRDRARARPSRRCRPGHSPSRWSGCRRVSEFRARAVGGDREARAQHAPVGQPKLRDMLAQGPARDGPRDALDAKPIAERRERADDIVVEGHMGERLVFRGEIEMGQAHGVAHPAVHDRHRQDRLRFRLNRRPGADLFEQAPRPVGDRDRAQMAGAPPRRARPDRRRRRRRLAPSPA